MSPTDLHHDPAAVAVQRDQIHALAARLPHPVSFMEVCGTHTHAIGAAGLRRMLPANVRLISGPGCPVCVTPVDYLDNAIALARRDDVTLCTFGDLIRVPASHTSLEKEIARGCDVRIVYSPQDALTLARHHPDRTVVFLAVGFETTIPAVAATLDEAQRTGVENFLILSGGRLIEPPLRALLTDPDVRIDGFLLPGHVSVIIGADAYRFLVTDYWTPGAIVGFTPVDILAGIIELLRQTIEHRPTVANLYTRAVRPEGNVVARSLVAQYFEPCDAAWRGLGLIPRSGLRLRPAFAHREARTIPSTIDSPVEPAGCRCGDVLKGVAAPDECPLFDTTCTPETPVGACMVSSEGTCAAWHRYERLTTGSLA